MIKVSIQYPHWHYPTSAIEPVTFGLLERAHITMQNIACGQRICVFHLVPITKSMLELHRIFNPFMYSYMRDDLCRKLETITIIH